MSDLLPHLKMLIDELVTARTWPHGPKAEPNEAQVAGNACVQLCAGDRDKGRTLWKTISKDLGGYMPHAAAVALIRASATDNIVPDIEAPEIQ